MGATAVIEGRLNPDGTLELMGSIPLPPGRVRVTLEAITEPESIWDVVDRIREERRARGAQGRTRQEIDDAIRAMREEWDTPSAGMEGPSNNPSQ